jgi:hypothetical protein
MPVSAVDCVQPALQHAREQLFTRFRFGQWSRLALVGILAAELRAGGCNFNSGHFAAPSQSNGNRFPFPSMPHGLPSFIHGHISPHLGQIVGLIAVAILAVFVLMFVFLYINSVFRFILFDSVLRRECSIGEGWRRYHRAGGRFFLWQLVFMISTWMCLALLVGLPLAIAFASGWMTDIREHIGRMIVGIILLVGLFVAFALTAAVIQVLARDFLVPIMALEDLDFADGWHRLLGMIQPEKGRFAVYLLLKLVLSIAAAILFGIIAIIPALFVLVPAVVAVIAGHEAGLGWNVTTISLAIIFGTLLLLLMIYLIALVCVPATVFFPAYSMYFFAARYPTLDALLHPSPPAPELPPVLESPPPAQPIG